MKKILLLLFALHFAGLSFGQLAYRQSSCDICPDGSSTRGNYMLLAEENETDPKVEFKIYPNPAVDFINFNNKAGEVKQVIVYNLIGRRVKELRADYGKNTYDISELSKGMYLIQLLGINNKVITTQRINKR